MWDDLLKEAPRAHTHAQRDGCILYSESVLSQQSLLTISGQAWANRKVPTQSFFEQEAPEFGKRKRATNRLLLTLLPPATPRKPLRKQTVGTVTASHKMLTVQELSSSLYAGTAKRGCLGRGKAFG